MTQITIPRLRAGRLAVALAASAALSVALGAALANTASAAVPDLLRVYASSATDSSSAKSATASCGLRRRLIGTAARIDGSLGQVVLEGVRPNAQLTAVTVTAHEDADGTSASWSVTATAICANISGLELVASSFNPDNPNDWPIGDTDRRRRYPKCPAGKQVVGAGGEVTGGDGHVVLDMIQTDWQLFEVVVQAEEQTPMPDTWSLTGYAICADPLPGLKFWENWTAMDSAPTGGKSVTASCASGTRLLGSMGSIQAGWEPYNDAAGKVGMVQFGPVNPLTQSVTVTALEHQSGTTHDWRAYAGAICASA